MSVRMRYLTTTLVLVSIGLGYALMQEYPRRSRLRLPSYPEAASRPRPLTPPLIAREILERSADLSLTASQRDRLVEMDAKWQQEWPPLEARLKGAEVEFSRFMDEAQKRGRVSLQEIQRRSEELRRLGAAWREVQERQAETARQVLTESQRKQLASATAQQPFGGK